MRPLTSILITLVGGGLTVAGISLSFAGGGPILDLRLVFWGVLLALGGLFIGGWGLVKFLLSDGSGANRARPSESYTTALGAPSAHSRTRRRRRRRRRESE